jgi:hypothetical protein
MNGLAFLAAGSLILAWNPMVPADIPAPPKKDESRIVAAVTIKHGAIKGEGRGVQAKIIIPKSLVHAGGKAGGAPPAAAPRTGNAPAADRQSNLPPLGTVIAGLAISLAAVSVVFIVRGNRSTKTAALAVLAGAMVLGAFGVANADLIAPGRGPAPPPLGEIVIELADGGDTVTLLLAK